MSKYILGTVQLGMKYGLANTHDQPSLEETFKILDVAFKSGITTFDTAWAYGTAEDVLGKWIEARSLKEKVNIISKMRPHILNEYPDGTPATEVIQRELEKSLKRIGIDSLDGYLCHSPYYIYLSHVIDALRKAKKEGLVRNIGVSVYDEAEALQAAELSMDYIQIPYNVFDQRLDGIGFFEIAQKNHVTVFARSPFLQGVLLMEPQDLPSHLDYLRPHLKKFISISKKHGMTPKEAALYFVHKKCRAQHIVFGVDSTQQMQDTLNVIARMPEKDNIKLLEELQENFKDLNKNAINPSLWSKIKKLQ